MLRFIVVKLGGRLVIAAMKEDVGVAFTKLSEENLGKCWEVEGVSTE
jgi:hypothetical protein